MRVSGANGEKIIVFVLVEKRFVDEGPRRYHSSDTSIEFLDSPKGIPRKFLAHSYEAFMFLDQDFEVLPKMQEWKATHRNTSSIELPRSEFDVECLCYFYGLIKI